MKVDLIIENKNYNTDIKSFELKLGLDIAIHSAMVTLTLNYRNSIFAEDKVKVNISGETVIDGKIKAVKTDNKNIILVISCATVALLKYPQENKIFTNAMVETVTNYIPELNIENLSDKTTRIEKIAFNVNHTFLETLDKLMLQSGCRFFSFNNKLTIISAEEAKQNFYSTLPKIVNESEIVNAVTIVNNDFDFGYYRITNKNALIPTICDEGNPQLRSVNFYVSSFSLLECKKALQLLKTLNEEKKILTKIRLKLNKNILYKPNERVQYKREIYKIISADYVFNYKTSYCELCLKK